MPTPRSKRPAPPPRPISDHVTPKHYALYDWDALTGLHAVVIGGGGFFGRHMVHNLLRYTDVKGVSLVDVRMPSYWDDRDERFDHWKDEGRLKTVVADIAGKPEALNAVMADADVVFHLASYGMSGPEMLDTNRIWTVNVGGLRTVLDACLLSRVPILIYTSSVNVVFGGQPIDGGDENMPYFPLDDHTDHYSRTKAIAEEQALKTNGTPFVKSRGGRTRKQDDERERLRRDGVLRTCAIRTNGIYGEGEERHFARIVTLVRMNLPIVTFGNPARQLVDWTHVDNLCLAQMLAAVRLIKESGGHHNVRAKAAGTAYFVSDGTPIRNFEALQKTIYPLYELRGPYINLSLRVVYRLFHLTEILYRLLSPLNLYPTLALFTRAEALKTGQHHWFKIDRIKKDLGYRSLTGTMEGFESMAVWWEVKDAGNVHRDVVERYPNVFRTMKLLCIIAAALAVAVFFRSRS